MYQQIMEKLQLSGQAPFHSSVLGTPLQDILFITNPPRLIYLFWLFLH